MTIRARVDPLRIGRLRAGSALAVVGLLLVLAVALMGHAGTHDPDFELGGPVGEAGPFKPGDVVWIGTNALRLVGSNDVTLVSLEPLGLPDGALVTTLYMPIAGTQGALGESPDWAVPAANRANAHDLRDAVISPSTGYFQLIATVVMPAQGMTVHGFRLSYTIAGGSRQVYIPHSDHLCDLSDLASCGPIEPYP